jgi:hypothetical protein
VFQYIWVNNLLLMFGLGLFSLFFFFYKFLIFRKAAFREMEISVANTVLDKKGPKRRNFKILTFCFSSNFNAVFPKMIIFLCY